MGINRVFISGRLPQCPVIRATADHLAVLTFAVAVNQRRKDTKTGEWKEQTTYLDCIMFGQRAEAVERSLGFGVEVSVEGHLRCWKQEHEGYTVPKVDVVVDEIMIAPSAPVATNKNQAAGALDSSGTEAAQSAYETDIPF